MFDISLPMVAFLLVAGHCLADYALQSDFLAQAKNRNTDIGKVFWKHGLFAHSAIHGLVVAVITGSWMLAIAETICHGVIDFLKCENKISLNVDQALHYACKALWFAVIYFLH